MNVSALEPPRDATAVSPPPCSARITSVDDIRVLSHTPLPVLQGYIDADRVLRTGYQAYRGDASLPQPARTPLAFLLHRTMNEQQRALFLEIICNSEDSTRAGVFMVDSGPGVGKSFTLAAVAAVVPCMYTVLTCVQCQAMANIGNTQAMTCCRFLMNALQRGYYDTISLWTNSEFRERSCVQQIYRLCRQARDAAAPGRIGERYRVYVLDEYTSASPWLIVFMVILASLQGVTLVVTGDKNQQDTLNPVRWHGYNNYALCTAIATHRHTLTRQMRFGGDQQFMAKVDQLRQLLHARNSVRPNEVPMTFPIKLMIYQLFTEHYTMPAVSTHLYLAQLHRQVKSRVQWLAEKAEHVLPIRVGVDGQALDEDPHCKFSLSLPLVAGHRYLYVPRQTRYPRVVEYVCLQEDGDRQVVMVRDVETNQATGVTRKRCSEPTVHKDLLAYFRQRDMCSSSSADGGPSMSSASQFPLAPYAMTLHKIQGSTIMAGTNIDVNGDTRSLNGMYVAVTRVQSERQIGRIETVDRLSMLVTTLMDDKMFYRCPPADDDDPVSREQVLERYTFQRVKTTQQFERANITRPLCILRTAYFGVIPRPVGVQTDMERFCSQALAMDREALQHVIDDEDRFVARFGGADATAAAAQPIRAVCDEVQPCTSKRVKTTSSGDDTMDVRQMFHMVSGPM